MPAARGTRGGLAARSRGGRRRLRAARDSPCRARSARCCPWLATAPHRAARATSHRAATLTRRMVAFLSLWVGAWLPNKSSATRWPLAFVKCFTKKIDLFSFLRIGYLISLSQTSMVILNIKSNDIGNLSCIEIKPWSRSVSTIHSQ